MRAGSLCPGGRCALIAVVILSLMTPQLVFPLAKAQEAATLQGVLFDPSGRPAPGFKIVFKDVVSGIEYTSSPSGVTGEYSIQVPVGARYQPVGALAPDGTRLPIGSSAPLPIRVASVYRRDVQFLATGGDHPVENTPPTASPEKRASTSPQASRHKKPWWKTTPGIVGIVVGAGAVAAAVSGGSGNASPSRP
jgi:hypothetical protein